MPTAAVTGAIERRPGKTSVRKSFQQLIELLLRMVFALGVYIDNGISTCFISPCADDELRMNASDSFENFRISQLPGLIGRVPGATTERLIYVTKAMKERKEL